MDSLEGKILGGMVTAEGQGRDDGGDQESKFDSDDGWRELKNALSEDEAEEAASGSDEFSASEGREYEGSNSDEGTDSSTTNGGGATPSFSHDKLARLTSYKDMVTYLEGTGRMHKVSSIGHYVGIIDGKPRVYKESELKAKFSHLSLADEPQRSLVAYWLRDNPNIQSCQKVDFLPGQPPMSDSVFNLFPGFPLSAEGGADCARLLKAWRAIGTSLCEGNDTYFGALEKYLAHMVQCPADNTTIPYGYSFVSRQGTGKDTFFDAVGRVVGCCCTNTSDAKSLFGEHAEGLYRKLLVIFNEVEGKSTKRYQDRIKELQTSETMVVNLKYERAKTVTNYARLIMLTNKADGIAVDSASGDRRNIIYKAEARFSDTTKYDDAFWRWLHKGFKSTAFVEHLHWHLLQVDLQGTSWVELRMSVLSPFYHNCITPVYVKFMRAFCESETCISAVHFKKGERVDGDKVKLRTSTMSNGCQAWLDGNCVGERVKHVRFKQGVEADFRSVVRPVLLNGNATWEFSKAETLAFIKSRWGGPSHGGPVPTPAPLVGDMTEEAFSNKYDI